ncbi:MAG TPA: hypothetical protein VF173_31680 [Thermoanaerobaculia bacterium]|nr:hypothetical protein [Thermoanaerobaculia bacterium]
MDLKKVDQIVQYALALAGEAEDARNRELGPIHLLKYTYLADLAFAQDGKGSFTGAPWRFHKFGPWSIEIYERLPRAAQAIEAVERKFPSKFRDQDGIRWRLQDRHLAEALEARLPWPVARTVKQAVRQFGNDTTGLLHYVYNTDPMLKAAPGELLVLDPEPPARPEEYVPEPPPLPALSKTKVKKLQEIVKAKLKEKAEAEARVVPEPAPRYDQVFALGQDWLDGLAGEPVTAERGKIYFSDAIWKSPGRRDPEIP